MTHSENVVLYREGACVPRFAIGFDGCLFQCSCGIPQLYILIKNPTEKILSQTDFKYSPIQLGLYKYGDVMTVAVKVGDLPWMDAPYTAHLDNPKDLPEWEGDELQLHVFLIDSYDGRVLGIRAIGVSKEFGKYMKHIMRNQLRRAFNYPRYQKQVAQIQMRYSPEQIGRDVSQVRYNVPDRSNE